MCSRATMTTNLVDYYVQHYIHPLQFGGLLLLAGTALYNMISNKVKHIAKGSLIILAIVDILIFFCMLPQSLGSFEVFYGNESFRRLVLTTKIPLYAVINLLSAVDTFLIVIITIEKYLRAKSSSLTKLLFSGRNYAGVLAVLFLMAFIVSSYHYFTYEQLTKMACDGSKMVTKVMLNRKYMTPETFAIFHSLSAIFVIIIPIIVVATLNHRIGAMIKNGKLSQMNSECLELFSSNEMLSRQKRKVTVVLPAITICFAVTHIVSYLPFLWDMLLVPYLGRSYYAETVSIINCFLISGKIANFALLYLSSVEMARNGLLAGY